MPPPFLQSLERSTLAPVLLAAGFWGLPTSSVDWCEANYQVTPYVAELWNTLSSLALVGAGLLGLIRHWRSLPARYLAAFALLALVGVGSIAFHATLRFELQMLDELPMLYLVTLMVYILLERASGPSQTKRFGRWLPVALVIYAAFLTALCAGNRGRLQFWIFQVSFGSLELWSLWRAIAIYRQTRLPELRRLFRLGMGAYVAGIAVWFCDIRFCPVLDGWLPRHGIPNPQLHAWWHGLVACGFYALVLFLARSDNHSS